MRTRDLVRLATGGRGVLPEGEIPVDLADRLTEEAGKVAGQVLNICIRALDYARRPISPGEYLRALITPRISTSNATTHLVTGSPLSPRPDSGIFPSNVEHLAVDECSVGAANVNCR